MSTLLSLMRQLNSKERFFLVGHALGNTTFTPSSEICRGIHNALGVEVPSSVFAAMDYHLDWIYASVYLSQTQDPLPIVLTETGCMSGSQEDIDFLIAFEDSRECRIVLLEAKGVTKWSNSQMNSKARPLISPPRSVARPQKATSPCRASRGLPPR